MFDPASYPNLTLVDHVLAQHKLTLLRNRACEAAEFRRVVRELALMLAFCATNDLPLRDVEVVTTQDRIYPGKMIEQKSLVLLPILRSGLLLAEAMLELTPMARSGHLGIYHSYKTGKLTIYLDAVPKGLKDDFVFLFDGVIGTGKSVKEAISILVKQHSFSLDQVRVLSLATHFSGVEEIYRDPEYSGVRLYTCAIENDDDGQGLPISSIGSVADRSGGTA